MPWSACALRSGSSRLRRTVSQARPSAYGVVKSDFQECLVPVSCATIPRDRALSQAAGRECAARAGENTAIFRRVVHRYASVRAGKGRYLTASPTRHEPVPDLNFTIVVLYASQSISSTEILLKILRGKSLPPCSMYSPFSSINGNSALVQFVFFLQTPTRLCLSSIVLWYPYRDSSGKPASV